MWRTRYQCATRSGLPTRTTSLSGNYMARGFTSRKSGWARFVARDIGNEEADSPADVIHSLPALRRRLDRLTSRKFVHRDEDLVNYLLPTHFIATGGCCATAGRDERFRAVVVVEERHMGHELYERII